LKLGKKGRESSKCNYYIISPRVIIKAIIIIKFFQPETLEGENAFWCGDCHDSHRATKTLSCTYIPTILIIHLKRLLPGEKIQNHTPFDTTLDMEPFMTPGLRPAQRMELIGMISHQGTGKNGHYVAATKKGTEWILYDDATTTQLTPAQLHRLQAYVLIHRKTIPNTETGAIPMADTSQQSTKKLEPVNQDHNCRMGSPPCPRTLRMNHTWNSNNIQQKELRSLSSAPHP